MLQARLRSLSQWVAFGLVIAMWAVPAHAQFGFGGVGFGRLGVVGGVSVDAEGLVQTISMEDRTDLLRQLRSTVGDPSGPLAERSDLRMVSLAKLQNEIALAMTEQRELTDEVLYLAGLQRIEFVFVYPERGDIVLAGPAEPWEVREDASVVGKFSGRPVLRLEDLLVALRTSEITRQQAISVSIDPTPEGELRLQQLLRQVRTGNGFSPAALEPAMKQAFGPQKVSLTAVPKDSRMAQVLVAADYQMKRIAMHLDSPQVPGLQSYLEMIRDGGASARIQPRWWIACDYDAILHSADFLAWKIDGLGINTLTEDQLISADGKREGTGKANKFAQRWADQFTQKFDQLCQVNSEFGDLRNVMDLNLVAAIISSHQLQELAGCDLSLLSGSDSSRLQTPVWQVPQWLHPQCSFVRGRAGWTVTASGGVEVNPWKLVSQRSRQDDSLNATRSKAAAPSNSWYWN
jgi:hypothetical protein